MNKEFTDQLSWEKFFQESKKDTKILMLNLLIG